MATPTIHESQSIPDEPQGQQIDSDTQLTHSEQIETPEAPAQPLVPLEELHTDEPHRFSTRSKIAAGALTGTLLLGGAAFALSGKEKPKATSQPNVVSTSQPANTLKSETSTETSTSGASPTSIAINTLTPTSGEDHLAWIDPTPAEVIGENPVDYLPQIAANISKAIDLNNLDLLKTTFSGAALETLQKSLPQLVDYVQQKRISDKDDMYHLSYRYIVAPDGVVSSDPNQDIIVIKEYSQVSGRYTVKPYVLQDIIQYTVQKLPTDVPGVTKKIVIDVKYVAPGNSSDTLAD